VALAHQNDSARANAAGLWHALALESTPGTMKNWDPEPLAASGLVGGLVVDAEALLKLLVDRCDWAGTAVWPDVSALLLARRRIPFSGRVAELNVSVRQTAV